MTSNTTFDIVPSMGPDFLLQFFAGRTFVNCNIELIKNPRDWGAGSIWVDTTQAGHIDYLDNGVGMNQDNRNAFVSVNRTTAHGPHQSGRFDTGSKHMLVSFCSRVEAVTAPQDDPDYIYTFTYTIDDLLKMASGEKITGERIRKTKTSWQYDFRFGTRLRYFFKDPKSRAILRGERLAEQLSRRLPLKIMNLVQVDGNPLPKKEVVGQIFQATVQNSALGTVTFEIYRPKHISPATDALRLGSVEIGEVTMRAFVDVLGELRSVMPIPDVFLSDGVCGTVTTVFLKDHSTEARNAFDSSVASDPRTIELLRTMQVQAPAICQALDIRIQDQIPEAEAVWGQVADMFNSAYNPKGKNAPTEAGIGNGGTVTAGGVVVETPDSRDPLSLVLTRREYEVGEKIEVNVRMDKSLGCQPAHILWNLSHSRAEEVARTDKGITLRATQEGAGAVTADIVGSPFYANTSYQVVRGRQFRLSLPTAQISAGGKLLLTTINVDKLSGVVVWEYHGVGELEAQGNRAILHTTGPGRGTVKAYDSRKPSTYATCDVTILTTGNFIWIEDVCLSYLTQALEGTPEYDKPATIKRQSQVHRLIINTRAPGYQQAVEQGIEMPFLAQATLLEYARFRLRELAPPDEIDPRDVDQLLRAVQNKAYEVYADLMKKTGKK